MGTMKFVSSRLKYSRLPACAVSACTVSACTVSESEPAIICRVQVVSSDNDPGFYG